MAMFLRAPKRSVNCRRMNFTSLSRAIRSTSCFVVPAMISHILSQKKTTFKNGAVFHRKPSSERRCSSLRHDPDAGRISMKFIMSVLRVFLQYITNPSARKTIFGEDAERILQNHKCLIWIPDENICEDALYKGITWICSWFLKKLTIIKNDGI